jgi:hypothetical protein
MNIMMNNTDYQVDMLNLHLLRHLLPSSMSNDKYIIKHKHDTQRKL